MANTPIKFWKSASAPQNPVAGTIWFDSANKLIKVYTSATTFEAYSGIQSISYSSQKLTWTNADGSSQAVNFSDVASAAKLSEAVADITAVSNAVKAEASRAADVEDDIIARVTAVANDLATANGEISKVSTAVENAKATASSAVASEAARAKAAEATIAADLASLSQAIGDTSASAGGLSTIVNTLLGAEGLDETLGSGKVISSITAGNDGKVTYGTKDVTALMNFSLSGNNLVITSEDGTTTKQVNLGVFAQDKYVSAVSYDATNKNLNFTWKEGDGSTTSVTVPVGDLVDTYTAGTGIKIEGNEISVTATDYVRSVNTGSTTAKDVNFTVTNGKLAGTVYGVASSADVTAAIGTALVTAQGYANTAKSEAIAAANSEAVVMVTNAVKEAQAYADAQVSGAVTEVKSYADTKKGEAISAAASDATGKADAAQAAAIATAAVDASAKASQAVTTAKAYTDEQVAAKATAAVTRAVSLAAEDAAAKATAAVVEAKAYADSLMTWAQF